MGSKKNHQSSALLAGIYVTSLNGVFYGGPLNEGRVDTFNQFNQSCLI